jgi:hypothetical protein
MYKYSVYRPSHTIEENYVLREIMKDHKLNQKRMYFSALLMKVFIIFNGARFIFNSFITLPA